MRSIPDVGSTAKGNDQVSRAPGYDTLGASDAVPQQVKVLQSVQLHCHLFREAQIRPALQKKHYLHAIS